MDTILFLAQSQTFHLDVKSSHAHLKFSPAPSFFLKPPHVWPGGVYQPSGTMGAPIRATKQQYIPLQQPSFPQQGFLESVDTGAIPTQPPASLDYPYTLPRGLPFGNG